MLNANAVIVYRGRKSGFLKESGGLQLSGLSLTYSHLINLEMMVII